MKLAEAPAPVADPVDKSAQRVRGMFGEIADRYDLMNHLLSLGIDKYWRWRTIRKVPPIPGGIVLDLCTGTGDLALAYAKAARGQSRVLGADFCHPMLVHAVSKGERRFGTRGGPSFFEADAMRLPVEADTCDVVTVAFGLRNIQDTDAGLREMVRVCRPGGKVAVLEFSMPVIPVLRSLYGWYFRRVLPRIGQWLAGNRFDAYHYLPESVSQFPEGPQLAERLQQAGLEQVTYHRLTLGISTLYIGVKGVQTFGS